MNLYYSLKRSYKTLRWRVRRRQVAQRWGEQLFAQTPAVLGNAMPKSGSHLIIQVLHGLRGLGPFVDPGFPPVNRAEDNSKLRDADVLANLQALHCGDMGYGYIQARQPFLPLFGKDKPNPLAMIFLYRDPRDFIISHVFYATSMHQGHGMHRYYNITLHTMEERISAAIRGVGDDEEALREGLSDSGLSDVRTKYEKYLDWLNNPAVLALRFEDLILERELALGRILDYLASYGFTPACERSTAIETLKQAIVPKSSGTFRKGKPGNWREHFTDANKALFKEVSGDLLLRLGYEQTQDW